MSTDGTFKLRLRPKAKTTEVAPRAPDAAFLRSGKGVTIGSNWRPSLREPYEDVRSSWNEAAARSVDMIQNSGFIAGLVDQAVVNVVGTGLRLKSKPDTDSLKISPEQAGKLGRTIERRFQLWSRRALECDAEARKSFGHLQAVAYRQFLAFGEALAVLPFKRRPGARYATKVRMMLPSQLASDTMLPYRVQGVNVDQFGAPISYIFKQKDRWGTENEITIKARDSAGRAQVVHQFDGMAQQIRGITPLAPALRVTTQFDQLANATLTAAILQQVFAATIETDEPTKDFLDAMLSAQEKVRGDQAPLDTWFDAQAGWNENAAIDLGIAGRFAHLYPGQKLNFTKATASAIDYEAFANYLMREIARCVGLTFESATGDYRNATYSSVRIATSDIWSVTKYRREHIIAPFCQEIFEAWLEEDIETGGLQVPGGIEGFRANPGAYARADWRGPPKPQADDLKTAKAFQVLREMGVMTDEQICEEYGTEVEDVYEGRKREADMRKEYKLPEGLVPAKLVAETDLMVKDEPNA